MDAGLPQVRLHQLEGFYYVGIHEGFTRAAEAMPYPITEPALHQQVRKLEGVLKVPLIVRGKKRRMELTPEGRALHRFITPYFERLPGILRSLAAGDAGVLVIAADSMFIDPLCAPAVAQVKADHPRAGLSVLERDLEPMTAGILRGDIDVGVATARGVPQGLHFEELGALGLSLLCPESHILASKRVIRPKDLAPHAFVLYERSSEARAFTDAALSEAGLELEVAGEASSARSLEALVRAGIAPAFVPRLGPPRPRRSTRPDGAVEFDLTALARQRSRLPPFGMIRRSPGKPRGLVAAFAEAARRLLAGRPPVAAVDEAVAASDAEASDTAANGVATAGAMGGGS